MPATPIFRDLSSSIKSVTINNSHAYFWLLPGTYDIEVACYTGGVLQLVAAKVPGNVLIGSFPCLDGDIEWIIKADNSYEIASNGLRWIGSFK